MKDLNENEEIIAEFKRHWMYFFWPAFFSFLGIPIIWLIYRIARYFCDEVILTNQRFNSKLGLFSIKNVSTKLDKIQNIYYNQSFLGRIFGYGDIVIQSAATFGTVGYTYVHNPKLIKGMIETAVENYILSQKKRQQKELIEQINMLNKK